MTFDLTTLALFVRAATLGAIGRAGAELGFSATNASHRIKALEADLGVVLFHRTTRAVTLTQDGETFLDHARRILDEVEAARAAVQGGPGSLRGVVRVTASASFARSHIVPFVPDFLAAHAGLRLDLNLSDTLVDIVEQGVDIAFRIGELEPSTLRARRIDDNPTWLVAAPAYLDRAGSPETPTDLVDHACIPFGRANSWRFRGKDGAAHSVPVSGPVSVNLGDAIGDWVLAGMGIGQAALWHAGPDIRAGRLVRVLPGYDVAPETGIWAVRPPGRIMPARVEVFLDFITGRIRATNRSRYGGLVSG